MKINRYKRVQRYLSFYRNNLNFKAIGSKETLKVIVDGTFCQHALDNRIQMDEQFQKYLGQPVCLYTTRCVLYELQLLGGKFLGSLTILNQYRLMPCKHLTDNNVPINPGQCIRRIIGGRNKFKLLVATMDRKLTGRLQTEVPNCPILYLFSRTLLLARPSKYSNEWAGDNEKKKLCYHGDKFERLQELKRKILGPDADKKPEEPVVKIKGPNPLSCKKKKQKPTPEPTQSEGSRKKRKRHRRAKKPNTASSDE